MFLIGLVVVLLTGCTGGAAVTDKDKELIRNAQWLSITEGDGYTQVEVLNPWKGNGELLQRYILVDRDSALADGYPAGTIVRTPLKNALVYSSIFTNAIVEVDGVESIKGVCDALYFKDKWVLDGLADGSIMDAGMSTAPNVERVIEMLPDGIILTPFQNSGYGAIGTIGSPIIECADYMETSALGRAEWIKFFGALYGKYEVADSIFTATAERYNALVALTKEFPEKPTVLVETVYSGVWYVPGGDSYMAKMLVDAGADYPWSGVEDSGSLALDFTQVYDRAEGADVWLVRSYDSDLTYSSLLGIHPLNDRFKAFKEEKVWGSNTSRTALYEEFPFHPDLLLKEYIAIFHPQVVEDDYEFRYFAPLND